MGDSTTPRLAKASASQGSLPPDLSANAADAAFVVWAQAAAGPQYMRAGHGAGTLAVAYSGGADSTALLRAAMRYWPGPVVALHVHHGLQLAADSFESHCCIACASLGVPLRVAHVDARHGRGESPEEQARVHRYQALANLAFEAGAERVVLAQHADDQVETLLLALSRGAGVAGLAAMPAAFERHGMRFERPLLDVPGRAIREDLQRDGVAYVQDPSNDDLSFTRNRIRRKLLPVLEEVFPSFRETFARSARHAAQAQSLLEMLAREDLAAVGNPPVINVLQGLPPARQANVLRHWLRQEAGSTGSEAQLNALLWQIAACRTRGHRIHLKIAHGHVLRENSRLIYQSSLL